MTSRPRVEGLEDRLVLSTILWDAANRPTGGAWNVASNWVGGHVPTAADDAVINLAAGTVTLNTGATDTVHSLTTNANARLALAGDTLTLATSSTAAGGIDLASGTLAGAGVLTLSGTSTWTGGNMSGSVTNAGSLTVSGATAKYLNGTLTNAGSLTVAAGAGSIYGQATAAAVVNQAGGTIDVQSDGTAFYQNNGGTLTNAGTLRKSGGTGTSTINFALNNSGTVQVDSGVVSATGGGSLGGTFVVKAGTLGLDGGTFTAQAGASESGAGTLRVNGGTLSLGSGVTAANMSAANFSLASGTVTGPGTLTTTGASTWTGGSLGNLSNAGSLTVSGATAKYLNGTLTNAGSLTVAAGAGSIYGQATAAAVVNQAGGTIDVQSDGTAFYQNNGGTLTNAGTLRKSGGTGTSTINFALNNSGTVQVDSGTLSLQGAFGNFSAATNTLTGGSYYVVGTLQFPGANVVTNAAAITLVGPGSKIVDASNQDGLRNFAANSGSFLLLVARNLTTPGAFVNSGGLNVGLNSTFAATGNYTQPGGSTTLSGGTLAARAGGVAINGGSLVGSGTVAGNVSINNTARVNPGGVGAAGILTIAGTYSQAAGTTLTVDLGGTTPGSGYDQLKVTGAATLDGTLAVNLINRFALRNGDSFQAIAANPRAGQFASFAPPSLPAGASLAAVYHAGDVTLTATVVPVLTSIAVAPSAPSVAKGLITPFTASGTYSDNSTADLTNQVAWSSSAPSVATVSNTDGSRGVATGLTTGSATITATLGNFTASVNLSVTAAVLQGIAVAPASPIVAKGLTTQFTATGTYSDGTTAALTGQVTWATSNPAIATVDSAGVATGVGQGVASVTATLGGVVGSASLTVASAALTAIAVAPTSPSVTAGSSASFTATGTYSDGTTASLTNLVTWSSSDPAVASISNADGSRGVATGLTTGAATISATLGDLSATATLTVTTLAAATVDTVGVAWGAAGSAGLRTADDGLRLLPAGRNADAPWLGINRFAITLSRSAALSAGDISVAGLIGVDYGPVTVVGSGTSYVITLARPVDAADRLTLTIGNAAIASFTRRLDVLPGDINDDGVVNAGDLTLERDALLANVPNVIGDVDGDGLVTVADYTAVRRKVGTKLPPLS